MKPLDIKKYIGTMTDSTHAPQKRHKLSGTASKLLRLQQRLALLV